MIQDNPQIVIKKKFTRRIENYIKNINKLKNRIPKHGMNIKWKNYMKE